MSYTDKDIEIKFKENKTFLIAVAEAVSSVDVFSSDFEDVKFLYENREKILRNKKLLDILG